MKNIIDIVNESTVLLCEAFKDPRLYQAQKTLQRYNLSWSDIFKYRYNIQIAWDKISDEDIEEIETSDTKAMNMFFKQVRKVKAGKDERPFVVLCMKNEMLQYVYDPDYDTLAYFTKYKYNYNLKSGVIWTNNDSHNKMNQSERFSRIKECDYILKVYLDNVDVRGLRDERKNTKNGAWMMTKNDHESRHLEKGVLGRSAGGRCKWDVDSDSFYGMCEKMANEAVYKWKKIVSENKFKRDQDTTEIDNLVKDIMMRLPNAATNATKDPEKYSVYDLEDLMKMVYDKESWSNPGHKTYKTTGRNGLLLTYQRYCQTTMRLKTDNDDPDYYYKNREIYKNEIKAIYSKVDVKLKEFNA